MRHVNDNLYKALDLPEILVRLFHPRPDQLMGRRGDGCFLIPTEEDIHIGAQLHHAGFDGATILFFHGNGEIVSDYEDIGVLYNQAGINFIVVDYRGYGQSNGSPTVSHMMRDSHGIFSFIRKYMKEKGYKGPFIIMGRSLGSASALELAASYQEEIDALIIESGFADIIPLLVLLGVDTGTLNINDAVSSMNLENAKCFRKKLLVIHAENDHIIPVGEGRALFDNSPSDDKELLIIKHADHNSIFYYGMNEYMRAIQKLAQGLD